MVIGMTMVFRDLNDVISLSTVDWCCRGSLEVSTIKLVNPREYLRTIRTKAASQRIKRRLNRRKSLFSEKLDRELDISRSSVQRILKNDRELHAY